jgi:glycosyltransferase involved in cell wall biosynthesis
MIVANQVSGDSRVIKTAFTLNKMGMKVHLVGINKTDSKKSLRGYPFDVTLVADPKIRMSEDGVWLDENGKKNISAYIQYISKNIADILRGVRCDVLHTHDMYGLAIGARLQEVLFPSPAPWVHDVHEYVLGCTHIDEHVVSVMDEYEQLNIKKPNALTTVSPILADILVARYAVIRPSLVLNAPRMADYNPWYRPTVRERLGLSIEVPLMVYCGNVKPQRGIHTALEAMVYLPDYHLVLITNSRGQYIDELKAFGKKHSIEDRLHIVPYVPYHDVSSYLRGATIGVIPLTKYGNTDLCLPTKLFEYLHAGIPVVATGLTAMTQFIEGHAIGGLFPEGDAVALAKAIQDVRFRFPSGLPPVNSEKSLARKYSWDEQEEVIASIYSKLPEITQFSEASEAMRMPGSIVHLPASSANQPYTLAHGMRKLGADAVAATIVSTGGYSYDRHKTLPAPECSLSAVRTHLSDEGLLLFDTFHFHARPLIYRGDYRFPTGIDLLLLKSMGKSIYFHYRGSEIRLPSLFKKLSPYHYVDDQDKPSSGAMPFKFEENDQLAFRSFISGVADEVLVTDPELQCYVPGSLIVPRAIDVSKCKGESLLSTGKIPVIVHAPSRRGVKGTSRVIDVINRLKESGYAIDFKLVEGMSHADAIELYRSADIIIDQLRIGWYGVLAVEGMALGKAVVSYVRDDLRHYLPYPAPLAIANPENIEAVLRYLLDNPDETRSLGARAYNYAREYHNTESIVDVLMQLYRRPFRPIDPVAVANYIEHQLGVSNKRRKHSKIKYKKYAVFASLAYYYRELKMALKNKGIRYALKKSYEVTRLKLSCSR